MRAAIAVPSLAIAVVLIASFLLAPLPLPAEPPPPPDVAAVPPDAEVTPSGLASKVLKAGTGSDHPQAQDLVEVHYTGWKTDGKMFDTSTDRPSPAGLPLDRVIAGWQEGLQLMVVGEKRRFWVPAVLAYQGRENLPQGMLVFDVELFAIDHRTPPPAPSDVAAVPADAEVTKSGLAFRVLQAGTGTERPKATSWVNVHYTGWKTDGTMFDSSVPRGRTTGFKLQDVIKGWREGLKLMVVGEKRRFWIPEKLAYRGKQEPKGMLVFEVELVSFR